MGAAAEMQNSWSVTGKNALHRYKSLPSLPRMCAGAGRHQGMLEVASSHVVYLRWETEQVLFAGNLCRR